MYVKGPSDQMTYHRKELVTVQATRNWGPWQLSNDGSILFQQDQELRHDWIELTRCTTPAEVLDTIFHTARHGQASDATIAGMIRALDDLLDPTVNLCSRGKLKTLTATQLRKLLDRAAAPNNTR
jgi:hypothetical protein